MESSASTLPNHVLPKISTIVHELHTELKQFYGNRLSTMILFGSQARGDSEPGSDIDILVVLKGEVNPVGEIEATGEIVSRISLENEEMVSCVFIDEQYYQTKQGGFMRNITREGILV